MTILVRLLRILLVAVAVAAAAAGSAVAQNGGAIHREQLPIIEGYIEKADKLAAEVERNADNDARLVEIRLELEELARQILASGVAFRPRLAEINTRLDQLGSPLGEGLPAEPEVVTEERAALIAEKAEINALIGRAESVSLTVNRLIADIATMRRDLFANTLSKRYDIDYALIRDFAGEFESKMGDLYSRVSSWLRFALRFKLASVLGATFLALLAAAVLMIGGRRIFGRLIVADPATEEPSYLSRLSVAFWSTLLPSAALGVFLGATYFLYQSYGVLRQDIAPILLSLVNVVTAVYFVNRLARAALSPKLPNWRLVAIETPAAHMLVWLITLTAAINGLDFLLGAVSEALGARLAFTVGTSLVATVLVGILVILIGMVKPYAGEEGESRRPWPILLRYMLFLLGGATIAAAMLGYIGLARFMSQQIVVTGAILATMYIGFLSASAISDEGAFARSALGRWLSRRRPFEEATLDQLGLVSSVAINILVLFWGLPLILFQWGFQWGDIEAWLYRAATGFTIGTITISFVGILTGILIFIGGYLLTRWFQRWLDGKVMARGRVDAGVRNSIRTGIGYAGVALAAILAISAAGIDLSSLALVAGALSLGIGFGLQNIVNNFVSGLILLAERPFKVGDWIVAGSVSGTVRKISVRATEIETFQRQTVILPNSELINAAVGNWTHRNRLGRIEIPIGVAYGADARKAQAILMEIARGHPLVLKNPEPSVLFTGFGDAALNFELRLFLADILTGSTVQNDIRFAILERFAEEGIGIPPPLRPGPIDPMTAVPLDAPPAPEEEDAQQPPAAEEPAPETPARRGRRRSEPEG